MHQVSRGQKAYSETTISNNLNTIPFEGWYTHVIIFSMHVCFESVGPTCYHKCKSVVGPMSSLLIKYSEKLILSASVFIVPTRRSPVSDFFAKVITVEPLTNDHPHQRPSLSYDHISCDGQWFLFVSSLVSSSSSSLSIRSVPWLSEGLSMPSPSYPVLCCLLPDRVAPVFVQVVSPPLGWSPFYFLVILEGARASTGLSLLCVDV